MAANENKKIENVVNEIKIDPSEDKSLKDSFVEGAKKHWLKVTIGLGVIATAIGAKRWLFPKLEDEYGDNSYGETGDVPFTTETVTEEVAA